MTWVKNCGIDNVHNSYDAQCISTILSPNLHTFVPAHPFLPTAMNRKTIRSKFKLDNRKLLLGPTRLTVKGTTCQEPKIYGDMNADV